MDWPHLIDETKGVDILNDRPLIKLTDNLNLRDCLQTLKENNITGAPVFESGGERARGFVDVLDVATYALHLWRNASHKLALNEFLDNNNFYDTNIKDIINFSGRNKMLTVNENANIFDCLDTFYKNNYCTHRLAVLNDKGEMVNLITMWDIVNFASNHPGKIPQGNKSMRHVNTLPVSMASVRHDELMCDALSTIVDNRIAGVGLLDYEQKLLANISASDFKGLLPGAFDMFDRNCLDFLRQATSVKSKVPPVNMYWGSTLAEVIKTMAEQKVHRVFLHSNDITPGLTTGLVSCTDILLAVSPHLKQHLVNPSD